MTALSELGTYVETNVAGLAQGTNLFLQDLPEYPDRVACIYQYPGGGPRYVQDDQYPSTELIQIQIVARDLMFDDAEALCSAIWRLLSGTRNTTLGSTRYVNIMPNSSPAEMKRDTRDRPLVFFNATVEKEPSSVS